MRGQNSQDILNANSRIQQRLRSPLNRIAKRNLPEPASQDAPPPKRILSIDGGGIRGIIPAVILAELEKRTGKPTSEMFDMIAGTSTGALIALALTAPDENGNPKWSAEDLVNMYKEEGPEIFDRSVWHRCVTLNGICGPKYSRKAVDDVASKYLGDTELKDALADILIPAYNIERRQPFFFRSERAREKESKNFMMKDVASAAVSAPTYFGAAQIENKNSHKLFSLIDGGVFANNPSMCAWSDLDRYQATMPDVMMLSLGTGNQIKPLDYNKAKNWGLRGWAPNILDVVFDGVANTSDYQLWEILGDEKYLRLQTDLKIASDSLDKADHYNIANLEKEAYKILEDKKEPLDYFVKKLENMSKSSYEIMPLPDSTSLSDSPEYKARHNIKKIWSERKTKENF